MNIKKGTEISPFPKEQLPLPVLDEAPEFLELYFKAWEFAWDHVYEQEGMPQSPYLDEGFADSTIWIWDTCFMVHFCKYAPDLYPGIQSLDNFYVPLHDGKSIPVSIQHPDNPPLFAWTEYEYYKFTGDDGRLRKILVDKEYLLKHYDFLETVKSGTELKSGFNCAIYWQKDEYGYQWRGCPNGMDNTPRGRGKHEDIYWVDALSQQILSAHHIALLADAIDEVEISAEYQKKADKLQKLLQTYYWDQQDGTFYDINRKDLTHCKVKTPASYWPLLADACSKEQAVRMLEHLNNPDIYADAMPWPTVSKDDPAYDLGGAYWNGSSWLPTTYMVAKGLQRFGHFDDAHKAAYKVLQKMYQTYVDVEPHTIWECYKPEDAEPALNEHGTLVRPDFCGWSALGPIAMLIEQVIGIHDVDAQNKTVKWESRLKSRHGIKRFKFSNITTSLIIDGTKLSVSSDGEFTLILNGSKYEIKEGEQEFSV